ncbi:MAG: efflux RND transporter periplasmic adaptor subunit [Hyphomicrobiales bacterium]
MTATWTKRLLMGLAAAGILAAVIYALMPAPVPVDVAEITRGPMRVTVDEEGETDIVDVYVVSAPIGGKLLRIPHKSGAEIEKDKTVVAVIQPGDPSFLDARTRRELAAAVEAAKANVEYAKTEIRKAESELSFAQSELKRAEQLAQRDTISQRTLEKAALDVELRKAALVQARANLDLRERELDSARARLIGPEHASSLIDDRSCCVQLHAPIDGQVLKVLKESEQVVQAGEPLLETGDPRSIEIVVDLLSSDATKVRPGAAAAIDGWGGHTLKARVTRIEPAAFTKVSALGIEEQRVYVHLELLDPWEERQALGHDFRVFVRITVWESEDALRLPLSALFRHQQDWAVFRLVEGRAVLTPVKIGQRNLESAEILDGIGQGDLVVVHPSDRVADGVKIFRRQ